MTNKEVIEWLVAIEEKYIHGGDERYDSKRREAIETAVEVLLHDTDSCEDCEHLLKGESDFPCSACKHNYASRWELKKPKKPTIWDKIRAEIKSLSNDNPSYWNKCDVVDRERVLEIIDKYREGEEE